MVRDVGKDGSGPVYISVEMGQCDMSKLPLVYEDEKKVWRRADQRNVSVEMSVEVGER